MLFPVTLALGRVTQSARRQGVDQRVVTIKIMGSPNIGVCAIHGVNHDDAMTPPSESLALARPESWGDGYVKVCNAVDVD